MASVARGGGRFTRAATEACALRVRVAWNSSANATKSGVPVLLLLLLLPLEERKVREGLACAIGWVGEWEERGRRREGAN